MARFATIPARAYFDPRVTDRHLRLLGLLGLHTDRNGWTWISQKKLASMMIDPSKKRGHVSQGRVSQMIKDLIEWGYVETHQRFGQDGRQLSNYTRVIFDAPDDPQTPEEAAEERETWMPQEASEDESPYPAPPPPISPSANTPHKPDAPPLAPDLIPPISLKANTNTPSRTPQVNSLKGAYGERDEGALPSAPSMAFGLIPPAKPIDESTPEGKRRASAARALEAGLAAVAEDPNQRFRDWFAAEDLWPLALAFIDTFRAPRNRREALGWLKPLREMAREGVAPKDVKDAVVQMIMDGIAIKSPATIVNKAITLAVARRAGIEAKPKSGSRSHGRFTPKRHASIAPPPRSAASVLQALGVDANNDDGSPASLTNNTPPHVAKRRLSHG